MPDSPGGASVVRYIYMVVYLQYKLLLYIGTAGVLLPPSKTPHWRQGCCEHTPSPAALSGSAHHELHRACSATVFPSDAWSSVIAMGADVQRVLAGIRSRCIILLHCLRAEGQRIYQTLHAGTSAAAPAVPSAATLANDKSAVTPPDEYDTALATLWHQFSTLCNVIVERHRFHRRNHNTSGS